MEGKTDRNSNLGVYGDHHRDGNDLPAGSTNVAFEPCLFSPMSRMPRGSRVRRLAMFQPYL